MNCEGLLDTLQKSVDGSIDTRHAPTGVTMPAVCAFFLAAEQARRRIGTF